MNERTQIIYVVDDDEAMRDSMTWLLEGEGYDVACYDSAESYLQAWRDDMRGCLILDVRMRGMSGLELQTRLQQVPNHPPIVMISAHGDVPMAVRALQAGALDFLEKPFNAQALLDSVHRAMQQDALRRGEASRLAEIKERIVRLTPREAGDLPDPLLDTGHALHLHRIVREAISTTSSKDGIIIAGLTGIIIFGFTGIIIAGFGEGKDDVPVNCGIIIAG